ncbi:AAA family ATPase [Deferribacterales bacterium Es71-Z0220]|uniref:nucleotide-binding protein n=1 Tax=Deferrivibrio essentukiensis TaxID=2880922 RepID=UPI001F607CC5|nr:AAA family ATPase [Deferrivibrio essentukiensis]MCB4203553.1 AAA family ATPase [Deferrivibrio essentukiensis]
MKISIVSGKGGAGKTTFTVLFANYLINKGVNVLINDLDVEEPNINLFLNKKLEYDNIYTYVPKHIKENCTYCKECAEKCLFKALVVAKDFWIVLPELCHSCKLCEYVCKYSAIEGDKRVIGKIGQSVDKVPHLLEGRLNIGESLTTALIKQVMCKSSNIKDNYDIILMDSPPGTSCPVIETSKGADKIVVVAEDTPFGFSDFVVLNDMLKEIGKDYYLIINKFIDGAEYLDFVAKNNIKILGKIPYDMNLARSYSGGHNMGVSIDFDSIYNTLLEGLR